MRFISSAFSVPQDWPGKREEGILLPLFFFENWARVRGQFEITGTIPEFQGVFAIIYSWRYQWDHFSRGNGKDGRVCGGNTSPAPQQSVADPLLSGAVTVDQFQALKMSASPT